jgi:HEPN domain-containing protein
MKPTEARARETREWLGKAAEDLASARLLFGSIDGTLYPLLEQADVLSDYAWKLRYPGAPYTPELEEAEAMLDLADRVLREMQSRLGPNLGGG